MIGKCVLGHINIKYIREIRNLKMVNKQYVMHTIKQEKRCWEQKHYYLNISREPKCVVR